MYDELIEELRRHHCDAKEDDTQEVCEECAYDVIIADKSVPSGIASVCVCGLMNRAADAIEELSKRVDESIPKDDAEIIIAEVAKPRWIPVTERLPEENGRYLVRYKRDIVLDYVEVHDDEVRIMRFFVDDGWRYPFLCQPELRKAEHQTVTHWMELPILPAEDNENG